MNDLNALGWDSSLYPAVDELEKIGLTPARVSWHARGHYGLLTPEPLSGCLAGRLEYNAVDARDLPCVGDWVLTRIVDDLGLIEEILPRRSLLARKAPGRASEVQPIAANVDLAVIVAAFGHELNVRRLERYVAMVLDSGAEPLIVVNKVDLCDDVDAAIIGLEPLECPVITASALERGGLDGLRAVLEAGLTLCLLGSSGVGKSTLINQLLGENAQQTQEIRADDEKGRHTTVRREMFTASGGALLIDTPGMRELQPWDTSEGVEAAFPEIEALSEHCRYRDCRHEGEAGCAVEGEIDGKRLASYRKLRRERAYLEQRRDRSAAANKKKRWKAVTKAMRVRRKSDPKLRDN